MRSKYSFARAPGVALALLIVAACSEHFPSPNERPDVVDDLRVRPTNATCVAPPLPVGRVRLEKKWEGFYKPVAMVDRPDLGLMYVAEMPGTVKVMDRATGQVSVALDLVGKGAGTYYEQGLLGIAIHPTKPYAYVTVERDQDASSRKDLLQHRAEILRYTLTDGGRVLDPTTEQIVLRVDRPSLLHYPGTLEFGPDGYLYIGVGDGGSYLFSEFRTQFPSTLLGTIVRIDVDSQEPYAIPADNPFVGNTSGIRPEIWARGFRNPWRFTFDRATGQMWGGDVGETSFEEVDLITKGGHYGWPTVEGNDCYEPRVGCDRSGLTSPEFVYPHAEGASVTGGYVYRGTKMPELTGKYIFGDYVVGRIFTLDGPPGARKAVLLNPGGPKPALSSFGEDADHELYALDWGTGIIYSLVAGDSESAPSMPEHLSESGCVDATDPTKAGPGLIPYDVNAELWSDGAAKRRFVALPDGTSIHVGDDAPMTLPEGSVAMKQFFVGGKPVETRFLLRHPSGDWTGVTYEWNDAGTDATRLDAAKTKVLPNGQTWTYPGPAQCFVCHTKAAGIVLGIEVAQLNRDFEYAPGHKSNQLAKLSELGYFDHAVEPSSSPHVARIDGPESVEDRARSYLHANCSHCHRPGTGMAGDRLDFRFDQPKSALAICTQSPFLGVDDARVIMPGAPERSAIYLRMNASDAYAMPPIARNVVDTRATSVIADWIRAMSPCE